MKKFFSRIFPAKGNKHSCEQLTASTKNKQEASSFSCDFIGIEEAVRLLKVVDPLYENTRPKGLSNVIASVKNAYIFVDRRLKLFWRKGVIDEQ